MQNLSEFTIQKLKEFTIYEEHPAFTCSLALGSKSLTYEASDAPNLLYSSTFFVARIIYGLACFTILPAVGSVICVGKAIYDRDWKFAAIALFDFSVAIVGTALVFVAFKLSLTVIPLFNLLSSMLGTAPMSQLALTTGNLLLRATVVAIPICASLWYASQPKDTFKV